MSTEFMVLFLLELSFMAVIGLMYTMMVLIAFKICDVIRKFYDYIVRLIERRFR